MMQKKSDDAVSPVIGVMLLLVVTIVIAGVVAAFGTGMVGNTETAPSVVLDVKIINFDYVLDGMSSHRDMNGPDFRITHVSGDTLDTGDIELRFSWTDKNGEKHHSTYSADTVSGQQPLYLEIKNAPTMPNGLVGVQFGDAELEPGFTIKTLIKTLEDTGANPEDEKQIHIGSPYMDQIFNNGIIITNDTFNDKGVMEFLEKGTKVDVTILHIPSNTIIYDKAVHVE